MTQHADAVSRRSFMRRSRRFFHVIDHEHEFSRDRQVLDDDEDDDALLLIRSFISRCKRLKIVDLLCCFLKRDKMLMSSNVVCDLSLKMSEICLHALHDWDDDETIDDEDDHDDEKSRTRKRSRRRKSCCSMQMMRRRRCEEDWWIKLLNRSELRLMKKNLQSQWT